MDIYTIFIDILSYLADGAGNIFIKSMEFIFSATGLAGLVGFLICLCLLKFKNDIVRWAFYIIIVLLLIIFIIYGLDLNFSNFFPEPTPTQSSEWVDL